MGTGIAMVVYAVLTHDDVTVDAIMVRRTLICSNRRNNTRDALLCKTIKSANDFVQSPYPSRLFIVGNSKGKDQNSLFSPTSPVGTTIVRPVVVLTSAATAHRRSFSAAAIASTASFAIASFRAATYVALSTAVAASPTAVVVDGYVSSS